jgi:hypothetical protein
MKKLFKNQEELTQVNQNLSELFKIELSELEYEDILLNSNCPEPWNKGKKMDQQYKDSHKVEITPEKYEKLVENLTKNRHKLYTKERNIKISNSLKGKTLSEERKQNISKSRIGTTLSIEHKQKLSNVLIGKPSRFSGHKHSEETKNKMAVAVRPPPWNKGLSGYRKKKSAA